MFYGANFPKVPYNVGGTNFLLADLSKRYRFVESVIRNKYILFTYTIKQGEKPHTVAQTLYGDSTLDWILFLTNNMIDPYFDWPLEDNEMSDYLRHKYDSVGNAKTEVYEYRQVLQRKEILIDGTIIPEKTVNIEHAVFQALPMSQRKIVSMYDYEIQANENKREIKVIEARYIPEILQEVEKLYVPSR